MNIQTFERKIATIITPARLLIFLTVILIIALVVVFGVFIFYYFHDGIKHTNADLGTFGDFVGGTLNPILSFLGLIAGSVFNLLLNFSNSFTKFISVDEQSNNSIVHFFGFRKTNCFSG
jgi:hypothetical protein